MKRCPTCNRTFEEDWLAFCTQDGTTLIEEAPAQPGEPPPTILSSAPPPPPSSGGLGSGPFQSQPVPPPVAPANFGQPSGGLGSGPFQPGQQMQAGWQPPPPPNYVQAPKQGIAIASMICGIGSITIGWCCYLGVIAAPVAIGLGVYQLIQIKNKPDEAGGKPLAIVGIATGAAYFVILVFIIIIYGGMIFLSGLK